MDTGENILGKEKFSGMEKKFKPLYEILTGKKLDMDKFYPKVKKTEEAEKEYPKPSEFEFFEEAKSQEELGGEMKFEGEAGIFQIPEIEVKFEDEEKEEKIEELKEEEVKTEEKEESEIFVEPYEVEVGEEEEVVEGAKEQVTTEDKIKTTLDFQEEIEKVEESEEIITEEFARRKITEKLVGGGKGERQPKKVVEGEENVKRRILVEIEPSYPYTDLQYEEGKSKIELMRGKEKTETSDISETYENEEIEKKISDEDGEKRKGIAGISEKDIIESIAEKIRRSLQSKEAERKIAERKAEGHVRDFGKYQATDFGRTDFKDTAKEEVRRVSLSGGKLLVQEIIDRIRSDIISKAEIEAKKRIDEAERKAREIIDNAYREAEKIINDAVTRSIDLSRDIEKEAEKKGYEKGFEEGYKEGEKKGYEDAFKKTLSEGRYATEMLRKIMDEVAYAKERFSDDFPKIVLHLTLVALKTVLMTEKLKDEELVVRVLKDALEKVKEFKIVKIRVNDSDYATIRKFFDIPPGVDIVPDPTVERGDVKIEMREGYFESSIKWREEVIEEVLKSELSSLSDNREKLSQFSMTNTQKTSPQNTELLKEKENSEEQKEEKKQREESTTGKPDLSETSE